MEARRLMLGCALAIGSLTGLADVSNDPIEWRTPRAPEPGTRQREAVAAAYAFRTPDREARFANAYEFVKAIYGCDYSKSVPEDAVVFSYDGAADPAGRTAAMQRMTDELEPGDVVMAKGTNGADGVIFYAGDVYGDGHGRALTLHKNAGFVTEAGAGGRLLNWPLGDAAKLRDAKSFRLVRPLWDARAKVAEKRAFPKGEIEFSDDERVRAVQALVWARYMKAQCIQYDSAIIVSEEVRKKSAGSSWSRQDYRQSVMEATPDKTGYTVCSVMAYEAYWELFGYGIGDDYKGHTSFDMTRFPPPDILVCKYDRTTNEKPPEQVLQEAWDALEPGDVIAYANVYDGNMGGHVMMYVGEVDGIRTILHSGGTKFAFGEGYDQVEYEGTMLKDDLYGYLFSPDKKGDLTKSGLLKRDQFVILRPLKRADLKLTAAGEAWAKHLKFRCDRRVAGGLYGSVVTGEELTYGIDLWNAAAASCDATVIETVPDGTEFVSASEGCEVKGRTLTWPIALQPGQRQAVSWTVRVTAQPGATIVSEGGSCGGLRSNRLTTEVVGRRASAEEAFAWADENLGKVGNLPGCAVRGWAGGRAMAYPPRNERTMETRSRDLMEGDVVASLPTKGGKKYRIWAKSRDGLVERTADGGLRPVAETEVTALMDCDFFMAFRLAAERQETGAEGQETGGEDPALTETRRTILEWYAPEVTDVRLTRSPERNGPIEISYCLSAPAVVLVDILTNGVTVGGDALSAMKGDAGHLVAAGNRKATWTAPQAGLTKGREDAAVEVTAKVQAWSRHSPPDYLVVDLTQPSNFTYYATAEAIPGGIQADVNKTDRMIFRKIPAAGATMTLGSGEGEATGAHTGVVSNTDTKDPDWASPDGYTVTGDHLPHPMGFTNDYYIAVYECTQAQWLHLFGKDANPWGATGCRHTNCVDSAQRPVTGRRYIDLRGNALNAHANWPADGHRVAPSSQIQRFRGFTGLEYDLPTEAQWEFAARAGVATISPSGNAFLLESEISEYAWNADNWRRDPVVAAAGENQLHAVGQLKPNAWGLYDMMGNASECCLDYMYGTPDEALDPLKGAFSVDYPGPCTNNAASQPYRVKRGSRYLEAATKMRLSRRASMNATLGSKDATLRAWLPAESPAWQAGK